MRRHVEVHRSGESPGGITWTSDEWVPVRSTLDRLPARVELLGFGMVIGLPSVLGTLLVPDPVVGALIGLAASAVLAAILPRYYQSRAERQSAIELDELEMQQTFQGRQIDKLNREAEKARRRR